MTPQELQNTLDKAKDIIKTIPGKVCIVSITYTAHNTVSAVIEFKENQKLSVLNIPNIKVLRSINNTVFNILITI